jgi:hypothetical protein
VSFVVAFAKGRGSFGHCKSVGEKELERRTSDGVVDAVGDMDLISRLKFDRNI